MRQIQHKEVRLPLHATDHQHRLVEVGLRMPWRMRQRHEDLLATLISLAHVILDAFISTIDHWLDEDMKVPRKQRHTAKRVFDRLRGECGFTGGHTIIYVCYEATAFRFP